MCTYPYTSKLLKTNLKKKKKQMGNGKMAQQIKHLLPSLTTSVWSLEQLLKGINQLTGCHCDLTYMQSFIHTEKKNNCKRQYKGWRDVHVLPAQAGVQIHKKSDMAAHTYSPRRQRQKDHKGSLATQPSYFVKSGFNATVSGVTDT